MTNVNDQGTQQTICIVSIMDIQVQVSIFFMLHWLLWNYTMKYAKDNSSPSILSLVSNCLLHHTGLYMFYTESQTMPIWTCVYC